MIDFGFDKIALIGAVALIVIGPEKLPRVARTVGHFIGKAQRYVSDVKAEVNRSIELDELKKMKSTFEDAARNVEQTVSNEIQQTTSDLNNLGNSWAGTDATNTPLPDYSAQHDSLRPPPEYKHPNKRWRLKQAAVPQWYKHRNGLSGRAQSGAARVARYRPRKEVTRAPHEL